MIARTLVSKRILFFATALLLAALALSGCRRVPSSQEERGAPATAPGPVAESAPPPLPPTSKQVADLSTAVIRVAKQNIPAVVHIDVTERQEVENPFSFFGNDPLLRRFFGMPEQPRKFRREVRGLGTGMVMDAQGHILTNNHVVAGATKIQVLLASGRSYPAKVLGTDPKTDLAVLEIPAKEPLPHVTFGNSDQVEVGEWVVAIGHPRGLDQTVTQGIISAKHRRGITDPSSYEDFLQTDAAINPGNSGGPLLDLYGRVIGVNAAIASQSGGSEGIGFAIPSNMALHIARQITSRGKVERGWLGVSIQDVTAENAKELGLSVLQGALVADVVKDGPAARAGIRKGDVVVSYGGLEIRDSGGLRNAVANTPVGQATKITLLRDGKRYDLTVQAGDSQRASQLLASTARERFGATVRAVTPREAERYGLDAQQGVVITALEPRGPLAAAGLEVGDLILQIQGEPLENADAFAELAASVQRGQRLVLFVVDHRTGNSGQVQVTAK
ncbi:MAG: trypsin-like peptidase domain-containing protein [Deltaproteobacteria bacterium]|nr:trypsin-like peptidase domain-containing protein [Deltaproteobacteria bacterium]